MTLPLDTLKGQIQEDVKSAMRARDQKRLTALRLITAAIKQVEIDQRIEMDDKAVLAVLDKMVKQRRDSLEQYQAAGRDDLAAQEQFELELISVYLPEALGEDELAALIKQAVADAGASSIRDMGAVMNILRGQVQGRADMKAVSNAVKEQLGV
ncbi:MAG: GatB/YqeY domain-containing protein [Xanthomonadales bacterium]|nr:GatB/YqeY domain-containing protein [Xanthomonadales bacterium]